MTEPRGDAGPPRVDVRSLLHAHGDRLLRSACLLCGDATDAQDLVQETFLQALKSADRFRGGSAVYTWLHGILLNLSRHHWRRRKRLVLDGDLALATPADGPAEAEADREFRGTSLMRALQTLSPEHREVIVLRFYENLRLQEIAAQTGVSPGTVKSRLHYALRCLEKLVPGELNLFASEGTHDRTLP
ncbi:MAG: RNA polymerase sigma factor [Verrucomicrobia bacterium]|nr:RNA polymerase sigma factor [Verrucomicrobiota bacterium]